MKKVTALVLLLGCLISFAACEDNGEESPSDTTADSTADTTNSDADESIAQPYFGGKVLEIYENRVLVEVTDMGNQQLPIGDVLFVNTGIEGAPEIAVGDHLRVIFDGKVALSYPGQILSVYELQKIDAQE